MFRLVSRTVLAGLFLLLLTACGSSTTGQLTNLVVPGVKTVVTGGGVVFGTAFSMIDATALGTTSVESLALSSPDANLSSQSLTELQAGLYVGMLTDIDSAGTTTLSLPSADEIPSATLVPATDAFVTIAAQVDCGVASEPASVGMSVNFFSLLGYPGFLGLISDSGDVVLGLGMVSDQALDPTSLPTDFTAYQWIYSDGSSVVSFEGTDCGPYRASQVEFRKGWNLLGWDLVNYGTAGTVAELVNVEQPESLFLNIVSPIAVTSASSDF